MMRDFEVSEEIPSLLTPTSTFQHDDPPRVVVRRRRGSGRRNGIVAALTLVRLAAHATAGRRRVGDD